MKIYTIRPLPWVETADRFFECEIGDLRYSVRDKEKYPPRGRNGERYLVKPSKGWVADGDWKEECTTHETQEEAKAACEAAFHERILPFLEPATQ
jgi:hypothetical protein